MTCKRCDGRKYTYDDGIGIPCKVCAAQSAPVDLERVREGIETAILRFDLLAVKRLRDDICPSVGSDELKKTLALLPTPSKE